MLARAMTITQPWTECQRANIFLRNAVASFRAAITAEVHFAGDLSIVLASPLVMLGSIARSLDPRVGGGQGQAAAGPGALEAREDFPFGASAAVQVSHRGAAAQ